MFDPETIIKGIAIFWLIGAVGYAGFRMLFWWAWKKGKITITLEEDKSPRKVS